ncbi:MAG TPA: glycoside hydrolase family 9 protein [Lacipirellulaceae bacterium]|nr:glycoside hydrolase family 9 protein [Lacipirellulaceae bacterium]
MRVLGCAWLAVVGCCCAALHAEAESFIRVNQVGYRPGDVKIAIALGREQLAEMFELVDAATGKVAFTAKARRLTEKWGQFPHHAELDFSAFANEGQYKIRLDGAQSPAFRIHSAAYAELPDQLLEFMRHQRCGYNPWVGEVCHSFDGRAAYGQLPDGSYVDARGGWHDAGDQLKYLITASNATAQMLLTYQLGTQTADARGRPAVQFNDRVNELGQPRPNGIPDLLDEARWGLDWMLRLHPAPEQLYHQVADDRDHAGFRLPHEETVDYGWGRGSYRVVYGADGKPQGLREFKSKSDGVANLAGRYAAAMAIAYQICKDDPHLAGYALQLLQAGKEVYALGKADEGVQQGNSYGAPYRYEESTWADDMEWGAAELFRATGDEHYLADALRYAELAATDGWMGREKIGHYQFYPFVNVGHFRLYDLVDDSLKQKLAGYYREQIEHCVRLSKDNPYRIGVPFIWCSNNLMVAMVTQCALYERMTGDSHYRAFTANHRDWLLGRNPWGFSMFTEIPVGGRYPTDVHLFANALLKRSVRGGLVDGPVRRSIFSNLKGVSITQPDPLAAFQDERAVYHDDIHDYSTNEPTMDGTASAILMWVVF